MSRLRTALGFVLLVALAAEGATPAPERLIGRSWPKITAERDLWRGGWALLPSPNTGSATGKSARAPTSADRLVCATSHPDAGSEVGASIPSAAESSGARDGFIEVGSLAELRQYTRQPGVRVRLRPGAYTLDQAESRHFIEISAPDSHWDLRGVTVRIDTRLFRRFGRGRDGGPSFYCVFSLTGDRIQFTGVRTENFGDQAGLQSKNKIFNITGSAVVLRDVDITTSGSSPWGYGSLYGISGGDVRKMNGIRVGWPARGVQLVGCRVHMRAMGHAIFLQGATDTRITDCHIDGLLRPTNEILAETAGYAFERQFRARGHDYSEGVRLGADGRILPDEMIALSEDGIRLYPDGGSGRPTGATTIERCTVVRMRRGICTGLGPAADRVIACEVRECVAAGFNAGTGDGLEGCRADARYAEALCLPYMGSRDARVELEILDSRGGLANDLLAVVNGRQHVVRLRTRDDTFVPAALQVALATARGYAFYQRLEPVATGIKITNDTPATVVEGPNGTGNEITNRDAAREEGRLEKSRLE